MVRQTGNTVISKKSWNQIVMGSGVQKVQQNSKSKKIQETQKKQQPQAKKANTQQLKQVQQYLEKPRNSIFASTSTYPRSVTSSQLKDLQNEFQAICNLFNANNYFGKSVYSQKKAWIQTGTSCVISVASCYSLRHKPVPNVIRPQQKRAMKSTGLKFIPKQNKNMKKNSKNNKSQPKFGENKQSSWGAEKAWGKNQPKQIREPPKQQKMKLQSQSNKRQQVPTRVVRTVNQKPLIRQAKPLRRRLEAVRKQNQLVVNDDFKYTLNQLVDAFNYFPKKSFSGDRAWKYNKFLGGFNSTASYFAQRNAPFIPSSHPKVNVTNGLPIYTFNTKPISKSFITPYNSNLHGVRTEGNGRYFNHWHIGSIWTHYYSKPKARRV